MKKKSFDQLLSFFDQEHAFLLHEVKHGLEKENLRINSKKKLSQKRHPTKLGSALFNPNITLDFSEAQIELVTNAYPKVEEALKELDDLHAFTYQSLDDEMLWPYSSPCPIADDNEVPLAHFGYTEKGYEKWLYRKGLSYRFGKKMQLLSGIHYNFSFNNSFWSFLHQKLESKIEMKDFISENYLNLSRNFLRMGWLTSYLFGSTPACDLSYPKTIEKPLEKMFSQTLYAPLGTSIRTSHMGYYSKIQEQQFISFNSLEEYKSDLVKALKTPHPFYEKIGLMRHGKRVQVNENFLQIEAEHYSRIRPKPYPVIKGRPACALREGIGYFEVRNIDINPFTPIGLDKELLYFKHLFFIYCLLSESPPISPDQAKIICQNQNKVALNGRQEGLHLTYDLSLKEVTLKNWAETILKNMEKIAALLDPKDRRYSKVLESQCKKVENPNLTPSAQQINVLKGKKQELSDFVFEKAKSYQMLFKKKELSKHVQTGFEKKAKASLKELEKSEKDSEDVLYGYEDMEPSTQMVLKEALQRGMHVEILDRQENFIRLSNHKKACLIKQATQTERDTLISYLAMESKSVTQKILKEKGLNTTKHTLYPTAENALKHYVCFQDKKVVIKPNKANFGEGISFVDPWDKESFRQAVNEIEARKDQILIEPFFEGKEYRFLVIGKKVVAVALRVPANVKGDGKNSIEKLIERKNQVIKSRERFQKQLSLSSDVLQNLKLQGYTEHSIPKKEEIVFLKKNSNVSTGGESYDQTDQMENGYKKIAIKATEAIGAHTCGVDILIQDMHLKPSASNHVIIELNYNPALFIHRFPTSGVKRYVEKDLLDDLF